MAGNDYLDTNARETAIGHAFEANTTVNKTGRFGLRDVLRKILSLGRVHLVYPRLHAFTNIKIAYFHGVR